MYSRSIPGVTSLSWLSTVLSRQSSASYVDEWNAKENPPSLERDLMVHSIAY